MVCQRDHYTHFYRSGQSRLDSAKARYGAGQDVSTLHLVPFDAFEKDADHVANLCLVDLLAEFLDPRDRRFLSATLSYDLDRVADVQRARVNVPGDDSPETANAKNILNCQSK
jgi:hypothetical protein